MYSKGIFKFFSLILIITLLSACNVLSPDIEKTPTMVEIQVTEEIPPTIAPTEVPQLPIQGVWFTQDHLKMLVITNEYIYYHQFEMGREVYARVDSFDLASETIEVFTTAIMFNGNSMGYDSPSSQINYHLNGTVLEFDGLYYDNNDTVLFIRDEFLNGE